MNDSAPPRWSEPAEVPAPTVYDPAEDPTPPFAGAADVTVILLLVEAADRDWAARAAIEMSDAWATRGRPVILADFHLEVPALDAELGGQGFEGVVDLFMYGASVARCARRIEGREFQFIPTGTYTPDLDAVFRHPRWSKLIDGFRNSDATFALFVPAAAADLGALATWVDRVILMGGHADREDLEPLRRSGAEIRGQVVPPAGESVMPAPLPNLPPRLRYPDPSRSPRDDEDDLHLPPPPPRIPHRGHRAAVLLLWTLLGLAVLIAFVYAAFSLSSARSARSEPAAATVGPIGAQVSATANIRPLGQPLPYSVRVVAYVGFDAARERARELGAEHPGVLFYVTPEILQGITYYKVMAGTLGSEEGAQRLRDRLLTDGVIDRADAVGDRSLIQELPFSLFVGERLIRGGARAAVDSLLDRNVPAYHLAVPYSDGSLHWHLYAGAFADSTGAQRLRDLFTGTGIETQVTARFGAPASPEL